MTFHDRAEWRVRLGAVAEVHFANILKWTTENFGPRQAAIYRDTLLQAIGELRTVPTCLDKGRATKSCRAYARSMLRGTAGEDVTSSCTALPKVESLKLAEFCTIKWIAASFTVSAKRGWQ